MLVLYKFHKGWKFSSICKCSSLLQRVEFLARTLTDANVNLEVSVNYRHVLVRDRRHCEFSWLTDALAYSQRDQSGSSVWIVNQRHLKKHFFEDKSCLIWVLLVKFEDKSLSDRIRHGRDLH